MPLLLDVTPLRASPAYRRLYAGFTLSNVGSQMSTVAIGLQVYAVTGSTAAVGLVGVFALVPLVVMGLYGGALLDHHDRRIVALIAQCVAWSASIACAVQAFAGNTNVWVLYAVTAVWSGGFAVSSPARQSIYPRLLPTELLPAANALSVTAMYTAMTVGPLLAGYLVGWAGFPAAYTVDAILTTAAVAGLVSLHPIPPGAVGADPPTTRPGLRSVWDGLAFLGTRPNVRMTFVADLIAMILAQPSVLFPAAGAVILGGGAQTVGTLAAAGAVGGIVAMALSGPLGAIVHQGRAVLVSILGWGVSVAGFGIALLGAGHAMSRELALALACASQVLAGGCDSVSAVFRNTILQAATPDQLRGRLQGIFIVVVAGGPRLGQLLAGAAAVWIGEGTTALAGGLACLAGIALCWRLSPGFVRYDATDPTP